LTDFVLFREEFEAFHVDDYMFGLPVQVPALHGVIELAFLALLIFQAFVPEKPIETFLQNLGREVQGKRDEGLLNLSCVLALLVATLDTRFDKAFDLITWHTFEQVLDHVDLELDRSLLLAQIVEEHVELIFNRGEQVQHKLLAIVLL
jgi:hypothetical protein